jgi:hypothetical protein
MPKVFPLATASILLGFVPIGVWTWLAYELVGLYRLAETAPAKGSEPAAVGTFVQLLLAPALVGGIMMIVGGTLLGRRPVAGRIVATIGTATVLVMGTASLFMIADAPRERLAAFGYGTLHCGLIAWLWLSRPAPHSASGRAGL